MAILKVELNLTRDIHAMTVTEKQTYYSEGNWRDAELIAQLATLEGWSSTITKVETHFPETIIERFKKHLKDGE